MKSLSNASQRFVALTNIFTGSFSGNLVGPLVAGMLYDSVGFRWGGVGVQAILAIAAAATLLVRCWDTRKMLVGDKLYQEIPAQEDINY